LKPVYNLYPKEYEKMGSVLTVKDVAEKLKMSESAVYKMSEKGKMPSLKIGSCRRFTREQIAAFLLSCKEKKEAVS
jgi:excisionase family DNA binding protein